MMNELKTEMQNRWNTHADSYDASHAHGVASPAEQTRWSELLRGRAPAKLLDVGCGTGFVTLLAAQAGLETTGVDWSDGMMALARQKAAAAGLPIHFVLSETEALPFAEGTFQYLTARHVVWTLTDPRAAFCEWFRVLAPGGCAFADYAPRSGPVQETHYRLAVERQLPLNCGAAPDVVAALLREAGFTSVEVRERRYEHPAHDTGERVSGVNYLFCCQK